MYYLHKGASEHRRMRNAVFTALGLHLVLISIVSFNSSDSHSKQPQIEVTLATNPSNSAPKETRHIAASAQEGSGNEAQRESVTAPSNLPAQAAVEQQARPRDSAREQHAGGELLSTVAAADRVTSDREESTQSLSDGLANDPRHRQQLASLQAEIDDRTRADANNPRVRRLTAVSARQAEDAAYLLEWRRRLEAVGNKYYPEASVRYGLYGDLRLLVVVRKDGHLENVRVLESSGYAVLDEAALKIVRMAAPFPAFPVELAATTDQLEIVRTWQFQKNELGSN